MAELREVFEMTTKQIEPDLDSWRKQEERQHRGARRKKLGALAVAAVIAIVAGIGIVWTLDSDDGARERTPATTGIGNEVGRGTYTLDLTTGELTPIADINPDSDLDVSPDGTRIALESVEVGVVDLDGANERFYDSTDPALLPSEEGTNAPRWSPDGRTLVYQLDGDSEQIGNLYALDVGSDEVTQLTDLQQISSHLWYMSPSYAPDGLSILFTSPEGPCGSCFPPIGKQDRQVWHLWSIPSSGGEPEIVVRDAGFGEYSPDGSMIAYTGISSNEDSELGADFGSLWVANADGTDRRQLATGKLVMPRWSPDGTRIAYGDVGRAGVYIVDVETGDTTKVADVDAWPEWVDDDTLLLPVE